MEINNVGSSVKNITGQPAGTSVTVACRVDSCLDVPYIVEFLNPAGEQIGHSVENSNSMLTAHYIAPVKSITKHLSLIHI